jgi:hypothetical protein
MGDLSLLEHCAGALPAFRSACFQWEPAGQRASSKVSTVKFPLDPFDVRCRRSMCGVTSVEGGISYFQFKICGLGAPTRRISLSYGCEDFSSGSVLAMPGVPRVTKS